MKILHVYDHTEPLQSGYVFRSRTLRSALIEAGHTCDVLSMPRHFAQGNGQTYISEIERSDNQTYYRVKPISFRLPLVSDFFEVFRAARLIKKLLKENEYDVIHAHSPILCGLAALWGVKMARAHNVLRCYEIRAFWEDAAVDHGTIFKDSFKYRLISTIETWLCQRFDRIYPICEPLKNDLIMRSIPAEKMTVIPNVVTENAFKHDINPVKIIELRDQYHINDQDYVLGFIGSFYAYEGLEELLPIIKKIKEQNFSIKLLLVGGGPVSGILKEFISKHKLEQTVIMTGRIPHQDVFDHYQLCTAMIYPRRSMRLTETVTPLKPLEAVAFGIPVILSDIGGHRELLTHQETGYFISNFKDTDKVSQELINLLQNHVLLQTLKNTSFIKIKQERLPSVIIKKYYQV